MCNDKKVAARSQDKEFLSCKKNESSWQTKKKGTSLCSTVITEGRSVLFIIDFGLGTYIWPLFLFIRAMATRCNHEAMAIFKSQDQI